MARRKSTASTADRKPDAKAAATQPGPEYDVEATRQSLARKLEMFGRDWRRCRRHACRRKRACDMRGVLCHAPRPPERPMSEAEWSFMKARLRRDLQRRLAEAREP